MNKLFVSFGNIFRKETENTQGNLYQITKKWLREQKIKFKEEPERSVISFVTSQSKSETDWIVFIDVFLDIDEDNQQVTLSSILPYQFTSHQQSEVIKFLMSLNSHILFGNFEIDFTNQLIIFQNSLMVKDDRLTSELLQNLFEDNFEQVKIYLPLIESILNEPQKDNIEDLLECQTTTDEIIQEYYPICVDLIDPINLPSLNLKHIQLAQQCPRLFYLVSHQGGETNFKHEQESSKQLFNELLDQLISKVLTDNRFSQLLNLSTDQLNTENVAQEIKELSYISVIFNYIQTHIKTNPQQAIIFQAIWQILTDLFKRWTDILIDNRHFYSSDTVFAKTFVAQNISVEHQFKLANQQQTIKGSLRDFVYNWKQKELLMIRYQANSLIDSLSQEIDLVLSSYLLQKQLNIPISSVTYLRLPDAKEITYSWCQIESIFWQFITQKIPQLHQWLEWKDPNPNSPPSTSYQQLCTICPQQKTCQSLFNPHSVIISPPPPPVVTDTIGQELVSILKAFSVQVEYIGSVLAPSFIRVKIKPAPGVKVVTIVNRSDDLQVHLGLESPPMLQPQAGFISVDIPRKDRQTARFEQYISKSTSEQMTIAIGIDLNGKLIEADLADPNTCHFLVAGGTGSGKSEFLRSLLLSLLVRHSPDTLQIALVDPKRVTFSECEKLPWLYAPIVKDTEDAINLMNQLVEIMEERYQILDKAKCPDLKTYNQLTDSPLSRIVCIFDEYADFMTEKESRTQLENSIKRLGAKARAAGIHLIISTQRPDATVVTPLIRSNLPGRIALRTNSEADSQIILGDKLAAKLLGKGDLLYKMAGKLERLQSLFVEKFFI
ncbi:DNA translocase FtsK [Chroococcus sp. FPU101]|uniref:DNA translocase FtsK n=1 Tax=Chroococcus sp. FPU101 TaxID=1974212 RepID=UPI001A8D14DD|nr:DNA translocase FtsK [Chroococcus sp. FPU101]GFE67948.1 hypothetical protein CFPU101_05580 [Chroococcus sp. FPU101]